MRIAPDSDIYFIMSVPIDNRYINTIYFANLQAQENYFLSKVAYQLTNQTYVRVNNNRISCSIPADTLRRCNYLMFRNTSFSGKWFYAFITNVEYDSNGTTLVDFELDVIQTWQRDIKWHQCFIERKHFATDRPGDNVQPEPIDIGDIICDTIATTGLFDSYVCVITTGKPNNDGTYGTYQGGLFSGLTYIAALIDNASQIKQLQDFIKSAVEANKFDSIVNCFVFPTKFWTTESMPVTKTFKVQRPTKNGTYTPINKKLLTYPYCYLSINTEGKDGIYRWEWFDELDDQPGVIGFTLIGSGTGTPEIYCYPYNYNGSTGVNYNEGINMTQFPQIGMAIDSFKAWIAQGGFFSTGIQIAGSALGAGASIATGNIIGTASSALGAANAVNSLIQAQNKPAQTKGNTNGSVEIASRTKDFYVRYMCVNPEQAKIIDDFFTRYGYACNKIEYPRFINRPHWNYIKTRDCTISGQIPSGDIRKICEIFDNGITWWKNGDEIGNYTLDNSPV